MSLKRVLISIFFIYLLPNFSNAQCEVQIDIKLNNAQTFENWPLVLHPTESTFYPSKSSPGKIYVERGAYLRLACARNRFAVINGKPEVITVACQNGANFVYNGGSYNFYQSFFCEKLPESSEQIISDGDIMQVSIGFQLQGNEFIRLITSDYNNVGQFVRSTNHMIYRLTNHRQTTDKGSFSKGLHPIRNIANYYNQQYVNNRMDQLIGPVNRKKYFSGQSFIARGHMAAKTDFPFVSQQIATFYYLNCFPQFQGFNNGNWKALEESIRDHDFESDVRTYTEVEDILELPNSEGNMVPIYLLDNNKFPIPQKINKIIITNDYIYSFVGYNYPSINSNEFSRYFKPCADKCNENRYSWLKPALLDINQRRDPTRGYFFCCDDIDNHPH